jgi:hypothetical protein
MRVPRAWPGGVCNPCGVLPMLKAIRRFFHSLRPYPWAQRFIFEPRERLLILLPLA